MIHFAWPYVFLIFPLPYLFGKIFSGGQKDIAAAVKVPFFYEVKSMTLRTGKQLPVLRRASGLWLLWGLLVLSAARPQIPDGIQSYTFPVRDILLTLDISNSMRQQDFFSDKGQQSRIDAVKAVAIDFVQERQGDRVGVVLFSEQANLYVPMTLDLQTVMAMIDGAELGLLGSLTAIGDALARSVQYLETSEAKHKVVILLTDGVNNAGNVAPLDALTAAKQAGVKVYTVGVGSNTTDRYDGIDEHLLRRIAMETGGEFFYTQNGMALKEAYQKISDSEPLSKTSAFLIPQKELYFYPLFIFMVIVSWGVLKRSWETFRYKKGVL